MNPKPKTLRIEDFPVLRDDTSLKEQFRQLHDYVFSLVQDLRYLLGNLSEENWNEDALKRLRSGLASAEALQQLTQTIQTLSEKVDALTGPDETAAAAANENAEEEIV